MMQLMREQARANQGATIQEERVGPFVIKETIAMGATGTVKLAIVSSIFYLTNRILFRSNRRLTFLHFQNTCNGSRCAVKIVNKTVSRRRKEARKEIKRLQSAEHENIVALQHVEEDLNNLYIFTEYCDYGDLSQYIQSRGIFDEHLAKKIFVQMVEAVDFCHTQMSICHHDIKLENCVITSDFRLKLIDFGFSVDLEPNIEMRKNNSIRIYDSSPAYSPLEILLRKPHDEKVKFCSLLLIQKLILTFFYL
jgi:serine/threonine protein kinase